MEVESFETPHRHTIMKTFAPLVFALLISGCGGSDFTVADSPSGDGGEAGDGVSPIDGAETGAIDSGVVETGVDTAPSAVVLTLPPTTEAPPGDQTFSYCPGSPSDVCIYGNEQGAIATSPVGFPSKVAKVRVKALVKARVEGLITTGICADSSPLVLELRFGTQGFAAVVVHRWTLTGPGTYDLDLAVGDVTVDYMLSGRKPFVTLDSPTRRGTALGCGTVRIPKGAFSVELVPG